MADEQYIKMMDTSGSYYKYLGIKRVSDDAFIPPSMDNKDYRAFMSWYEEQDPKPFTLQDEQKPESTVVAEKKQAIKKQARREILAIVPEWKQINALARCVELLKKYIVEGELTRQELKEIERLEALWDRIKKIRKKSDRDEQELGD